MITSLWILLAATYIILGIFLLISVLSAIATKRRFRQASRQWDELQKRIDENENSQNDPRE